MTKVKICGVTTAPDAQHAVAAGADAIGLNFYPKSSRCVDADTAKTIVAAVAGRALCVGVFVDMPATRVAELKSEVGLDCVQLHGNEPPDYLTGFLPHAYKALRVRGPEALDEAADYPGEHVLLDAYVPGEPGGTGARFDWKIAANLATRRKVTLAGGLTPDNVADAITAVRPFCVDVASGVESSPGRKDASLVTRFIAAAHKAGLAAQV